MMINHKSVILNSGVKIWIFSFSSILIDMFGNIRFCPALQFYPSVDYSLNMLFFVLHSELISKWSIRNLPQKILLFWAMTNTYKSCVTLIPFILILQLEILDNVSHDAFLYAIMRSLLPCNAMLQYMVCIFNKHIRCCHIF